MTRHEFNSCFLNLYRHGWVVIFASRKLDCIDAGMTCADGMRTPIPSWAGTPLSPASPLVTSFS